MERKIVEEQLSTITHEQIHSISEPGKLGLHTYNEEEILYRLNSYKSFVIVRNPYSRALSCYLDKFTPNSMESLKVRRHIHFKYHNMSSNRVSFDDLKVTFQEYVKYLGDPEVTFTDPRKPYRGGPEEHWMAMSELCFPCQMGYDYIGKLETLETDAKFILKHFGVPQLLDVIRNIPPHTGHTKPSVTNSSKTAVENYFKQVSDDDIDGLRWRYEKDFKIFGYNEDITAT